jgi:glycerophosphoryl diester phosphodiesterase
VVIHDPTLWRTGRRKSPVSALTSGELGRTDVGSWFNQAYPQKARSCFTGQTVPTLCDTLALLQRHDGLIYVELKCGGGNAEHLTRSVCEVIGSSSTFSRIVLKSFDLEILALARRLLPGVQTAALFEFSAKNILRASQVVDRAREVKADQLSVHRPLANERLVRLATLAKLPVLVWTVDDARWVNKARKHGVYALITNDPKKMLESRRVGRDQR